MLLDKMQMLDDENQAPPARRVRRAGRAVRGRGLGGTPPGPSWKLCRSPPTESFSETHPEHAGKAGARFPTARDFKQHCLSRAPPVPPSQP